MSHEEEARKIHFAPGFIKLNYILRHVKRGNRQIDWIVFEWEKEGRGNSCKSDLFLYTSR